MDDERDLPPLPIRPPQGPPAESSRTRRSHRSKDRNSAREIATLLLLEQRGHRDAQRELSRVTELLRLETLRANEAESRVLELTTRLKSINEARVTAVREAARANESLGLYKFQLETAQNEIHRAQSVFDLVEKERYRAEVAGAKTRTTARKLLERHKIHMAREEGRRMGLQEGLEAGRVGVYREVDAQSNFGDSQINDLDDDESESDHDDYAATEALDSPSPPRNDPPILPASPVRPSPAPEPPLSPIYVPLHDIHPILVHNAAPHPQHGHFNVPPEGYIPTTTATDPILHIPPAHEFVEPTPPIADASGAAGESGVAPSAFVTPHRSHHGSPSQSMRAESVRRAPSAAGSGRPVQMPVPRTSTNISNMEHRARQPSVGRRSSLSSDFFGGGSARDSSDPIAISVLPPSRPQSYASSRSGKNGNPARGNHFFGPEAGTEPGSPVGSSRHSPMPNIYANIPNAPGVAGPLANGSISAGFVPLGFQVHNPDASTEPPSVHIPGAYTLPNRPHNRTAEEAEDYELFGSQGEGSESTHSSLMQTSTPNTLTTPPERRRPHPRKPPRDPGFVRPRQEPAGPGFGYDE